MSPVYQIKHYHIQINADLCPLEESRKDMRFLKPGHSLGQLGYVVDSITNLAKQLSHTHSYRNSTNSASLYLDLFHQVDKNEDQPSCILNSL